MSFDIAVRPMTEHDLPVVLDMIAASETLAADTVTEMVTAAVVDGWPSAQAGAFVAVDGHGTVLGTIAFYPLPYADPAVMIVAFLYVVPAARRHGVGADLCRCVGNFAHAHGYDTVKLDLEDGTVDQWLGFLRSAGFYPDRIPGSDASPDTSPSWLSWSNTVELPEPLASIRPAPFR